MVGFTTHMTSFSGGAISKNMYGRFDSPLYPTSVRECHNYVPMVQGPVTRRPGTIHVASVSGDRVRLIPITYDNDKSFCLEFGDGYLKFHTDGGTVTQGGSDFTLSTPYGVDDIGELYTAQNGDDVYIAHPLHHPLRLSADGDYWTLTQPILLPAPLLAQSGAATLNVAGGVCTSSSSLFVASDVGRQIRMRQTHHGNRWVLFTIDTYVSPTQVSGNVREEKITVLDASSPSAFPLVNVTRWAFTAWGLGEGAIGYPSTVAFSQQRLVYGGYDKRPNRVDGSVIGSYDAFSITSPVTDSVLSTTAYSIEVSNNQRNKVKWMLGDDRGLIVGTEATEFTITQGVDGDALSSVNVVARTSSSTGSSLGRACRLGKSTLFVGRSGETLNSIAYDSIGDRYEVDKLTIRAADIFASGIRDIVSIEEPTPIVWALLDGGTLASLTLSRTQNVVAAATHDIGGVVESLADVVSPDGTYTELWVAVRRGVNLVIERLSKYWDVSSSISESVYLDAASLYDGTPTGILTGAGLSVHEGGTVQVVGDGSYLGEYPVQGGQVDLGTTTVSTAVIGIPYESYISTLTPEVPTRMFTNTVGMVMSITRGKVQLWDTVGLYSFDLDYSTTFRTFNQLGSVSLFSGFKQLKNIGRSTQQPSIKIGTVDPFPSNISSLMLELDVKGTGSAN